MALFVINLNLFSNTAVLCRRRRVNNNNLNLYFYLWKQKNFNDQSNRVINWMASFSIKVNVIPCFDLSWKLYRKHHIVFIHSQKKPLGKVFCTWTKCKNIISVRGMSKNWLTQQRKQSWDFFFYCLIEIENSCYWNILWYQQKSIIIARNQRFTMVQQSTYMMIYNISKCHRCI